MLPSLFGLSSLTMLKLRNCNLCEGDIPSDISRRSSLIHLDLGGNNFVSIPLCLAQFSKLEFLRLSYCRALKSLPELPTSIKDVRINGCASLETNCGYNHPFDTDLIVLEMEVGFSAVRVSLGPVRHFQDFPGRFLGQDSYQELVPVLSTSQRHCICVLSWIKFCL
ncbi:disease resistance-like protein DSC1 [Gossypium arboreum]|uniref:disease resistance-like protein DSC1 n=1 Tax=Gossypium arboreum TaxID=29729 RepID=UPI0022F1993A|nr:disease resistance-like protein DSC1 [Gossypium arboreum]